MRRGAPVFLVVILIIAAYRGYAQGVDASLAADAAAVNAEIRKAEGEDQELSGGLVKSLIFLRLATLRHTLALLDQRSKAGLTRATLRYTIEGRPFVPPSDATAQIAALQEELSENAAKVAKQESEAARYSGGLVQATALVTLAALRQTQAMLDQKRLALKYGLPQFIGFKDFLPSTPVSASVSQPAPVVPSGRVASGQTAQVPELPTDCVKVVFGSYCLGRPLSSLPPSPARKTDDMWVYLEPQATMVTVVEGRVGAVGRLYTPGTWLTYRNVEGDLSEKYGTGKDLSFFPSYADDSSSRETAISLKKGRAVHSWQQQGFTIQLKWESSEHVGLIYFHDELEAKRAGKKKDQY